MRSSNFSGFSRHQVLMSHKFSRLPEPLHPRSGLQGTVPFTCVTKASNSKCPELNSFPPKAASSSYVLFISGRHHSPSKDLRLYPPLPSLTFHNWSIRSSGHLSFFFISLSPIQLCPPPLPWTITGTFLAVSLNLGLTPPQVSSTCCQNHPF